MSVQRHAHSVQDAFIDLLEGHAVLVTDEGETALSPGLCAGFEVGTGNGQQLINRSNADVVYLEAGDRNVGDAATYPDDDLKTSVDPDGKSRPLSLASVVRLNRPRRSVSSAAHAIHILIKCGTRVSTMR
jgi:uncharacterized cupin superfamily protein